MIWSGIERELFRFYRKSSKLIASIYQMSEVLFGRLRCFHQTSWSDVSVEYVYETPQYRLMSVELSCKHWRASNNIQFALDLSARWTENRRCKFKSPGSETILKLNQNDFVFVIHSISLVCGDVKGNFKVLFNKLTNINSKSGPFEFLLCVGDFFGSDNGKLEAYKNGNLQSEFTANKASNLYPNSMFFYLFRSCCTHIHSRSKWSGTCQFVRRLGQWGDMPEPHLLGATWIVYSFVRRQDCLRQRCGGERWSRTGRMEFQRRRCEVGGHIVFGE